MSSTNGRAVASIGFENLDILFKSEGFIKGTLAVFNSEPSAPAFNFLMNTMDSNLDSAYYITTRQLPSVIREELAWLGNKTEDIQGIIPKHDELDCESITETVLDLPLSEDIVIIDSLDVIDPGHGEMERMYKDLKEIAVETDSVVLLHRVVSDAFNITEGNEVDYMADLIFSITVSLSEEGVNERLWFEKLPIDEGFKPSQANRRVVKLNSDSGRLSVNTGGSI